MEGDLNSMMLSLPSLARQAIEELPVRTLVRNCLRTQRCHCRSPWQTHLKQATDCQQHVYCSGAVCRQDARERRATSANWVTQLKECHSWMARAQKWKAGSCSLHPPSLPYPICTTSTPHHDNKIRGK
eukprot:1405335-Amphidinium_carterae.1